MADMMNMIQQAQSMLEKARSELQGLTVTGTAGGGMVTAEVTGEGHLKRIKIDPGVVVPADTEMLEDLIVVAIVDAQKKAQGAAQQMAEERFGALGGGMGSPFKLPF